jgi:hypothetical protein
MTALCDEEAVGADWLIRGSALLRPEDPASAAVVRQRSPSAYTTGIIGRGPVFG